MFAGARAWSEWRNRRTPDADGTARVRLLKVVATFRSARRVETRTSTEPSLHDLCLLASSVQIALAAFAVAAFFHPIAYQFYFFCVAGLAVALRNACVAELSAVSAGAR